MLASGLLVLSILIAGALYLPVYLEKRLIPQTARKFGVSVDRIGVRRVGLTGADLGPVELSVGDTPGLHITAIQIDYSPASLLRRKVSGITISGLQVGISVSETGISIAGVTLPTHAAQEKEATPPPSRQIALPIEVSRFRIENTIVDIDWRDRRLQVPLEIDCTTAQAAQGRLSARIALYPRGNPMEIGVELNLEDNYASLDLTRAQFLLESVADITELVAPTAIGGTLTARGNVRCQLTPFEIETMTFSGQLSRLLVTFGEWAITNSTADDKQVQPLDLALRQESTNRYTWSGGPLAASGPASLQVDTLNGQLARTDNGWHLSADVHTRLPAQVLNSGNAGAVALEEDVVAAVQMTADRTADGKIAFAMASRTEEQPQPLRLRMADHPGTSGPPRWSLRGTYTPEAIAAQFNAAVADLSFGLPEGKVHSADLSVEMDATVRFAAGGPEAEISTTVRLKDLTADMGTTRAEIPKLSVRVVMHQEGSVPLTLAGDLQMTAGQLHDTQRGFSAGKIDASLPFNWPPVPTPARGSVKIGSVQLQRQALGGLTGTLVQQESGLAISAVHQSKLLKGLRVSIEARANSSGGTVDVKVPPYQPDADIDLGRFAAAAAGFSAGGRLEADARLAWNAAGATSADARIKLESGHLAQTDNSIMLTGIGAEIRFEDLIAMRSGPRQKLSIDTLRAGDVTASDLRVNFQVEPAATLFIEKTTVQWCQGMINTSAIRIKPEVDDYDLTLVCDRLNLAMVLRQLGAAQGSGDGSVSGVIPVHWANGHLSFDKGFLYSTPGQPGTIQLHDTEFLLAGLAPGSPQHTQLDIATEALKDYTYNWAKLSLESDRETLLVKLQLDGKPNRLLPFAYDQDLGVLKRIQGKGQADFKGIAIDLNFRSPINEILNYKELLKTR
jgi:hypothetical protein